jgi:hypothetical protein
MDSVYFYNAGQGFITPSTINNTKLYQVENLSKKEEYKYFSK